MPNYETFEDFKQRHGFDSTREIYLQYIYGTWEPTREDLELFENRYLSAELASAFIIAERVKWERAKNGSKTEIQLADGV